MGRRRKRVKRPAKMKHTAYGASRPVRDASRPGGGPHPSHVQVDVPPPQDVGQHPLAEAADVAKHRFGLLLPASCLFCIVIRAISSSDGLRKGVASLVLSRKLELILAMIGTILTLVDVVGPQRMRAVETVFFRTFARQSFDLFIRGAFRRIGAYFRAYIGPEFLYERDLLFSAAVLIASLRWLDMDDSLWLLTMGTTRPTRGDSLGAVLIVLWVGMGLHTLIWNDLCQRVLFNFSSSFVYRGRPLVQAASTTNQSDMRGLVRHRRTRANSETFRREPGVLRTRIRPLSPPVAKGVSPMARIVPAPRIVFFSLSLILFLFRRRPQAITSSLPGSNGPLPLARRSGFGGGG